ncbi:MAG TPA: hypothetical protein DF774_08710 [Rheinheimera sp.]|nr:hypothetical protein [Rheinheimera sp.]
MFVPAEAITIVSLFIRLMVFAIGLTNKFSFYIKNNTQAKTWRMQQKSKKSFWRKHETNL